MARPAVALVLVFAGLIVAGAMLTTVLLRDEARDSAAGAAVTADAKSDAPSRAEIVSAESPATLPEEPRVEVEVDLAAEQLEHGAAYKRELSEAIWVEGRVVFPEGTPLGERVTVEARGAKFKHGPPLHSAVVGSDGRFRVAFSSRTEKNASLAIDARYLYLDEPQPFDPAAPPAEIILMPKLGGRIVGTVQPPPARLLESWDFTDVKVKALAYAPRGPRSWSNSKARTATIAGDLTFEIRGIPATERCDVDCDPGIFPPVNVDGLLVRPGEDTVRDLVFDRGVRVSGRVVDPSGVPVAKARVAASSRSSFRGSSTDRSTRTGDDGTFDLRGVKAGTIEVEASIKGAPPSVWRSERMADGDEARDVEIVVGAGLAITGVVTWPDGSPAGSTTVELTWETGGSWGNRGTEKVSTRADQNGRFRITGLKDRTYDLRARAETPRDPQTLERATMLALLEDVRGGPDVVLALRPGHDVVGRVIDDTGAAIASDCVVSAELTDVEDWELRASYGRGAQCDSTTGTFVLQDLAPGPWEIKATTSNGLVSVPVRINLPAGDDEEITLVIPRSASIAGTVLDVRGRPVAEASLDAQRGGGETSLFPHLDQSTDEEGRFRIEALPGELRLSAVKEGYARSGEVVLELEPAQHVEGITLTLGVGGIITGELVGVAEVAGREINGWNDREHRDARTDDCGRFRLEGLTPGTWRLNMEPTPAELATIDESDWVAASSLNKSAKVTVADGETVHVRLGAPADEAVRVYGRAILGDEPAAGVQVFAMAATPSGSSAGTSLSGGAKTNGSGDYEFEVAAPGEYVFWIASEKPAYQTSRQVTIPAGESFRFDVEVRLSSISGRVFGPDGAPLAGERVVGTSGAPPDAITNTTTGSSGAYTLSVAPGTWTVSAGGSTFGESSGTAYARAERDGIQVGADAAVAGVDLHLAHGGTLTGRVVDSGGAGVRMAMVYVSTADNRLVPTPTVSQSDGEYTLSGVAPGRIHAIAVSKDGFARASAVVTANAVTQLDLKLALGVVLTVDVADSEGAGGAAMVEVWSSDGLQMPRYPFLLKGTNQPCFGPLPPDTYTVIAGRGEASARTTVAVSTASEQTVQIVLKR